MGGGGHGHGHGEAVEARLFGEPPVPAGQSRKMEMWEPSYYFLAGSMAVLGVAAYLRPSTNPKDWALDEAEERARRRIAGKEVVYGVNYAAIRYMKEQGVISPEEAERLESGEVVPPALPKVQSAKLM